MVFALLAVFSLLFAATHSNPLIGRYSGSKVRRELRRPSRPLTSAGFA